MKTGYHKCFDHECYMEAWTHSWSCPHECCLNRWFKATLRKPLFHLHSSIPHNLPPLPNKDARKQVVRECAMTTSLPHRCRQPYVSSNTHLPTWNGTTMGFKSQVGESWLPRLTGDPLRK